LVRDIPTEGPTLYIGAEDPDPVLRIRLTAIARYYNTSFKDLIAGGFHALNLFGKDAAIFYYNIRTMRVETTPLYQQIFEAAADIRPINISLDPLARIFIGNEIDRSQVYGLVGHAQALAMASGGSVTLLSHPSLQGINSGSGLSGSTTWHDAFRYRQYLKAAKEDDTSDPVDTGLRELAFLKNQYGPPANSIILRYERGLFLPETGTTGLEKVARDAQVDQAFLDLLRRFASEGRNVSNNSRATGYAATIFAEQESAKAARMRKADFKQAIERLFAAGKLTIESYRREGHDHERLAIK
jgi:RecA-family ATPase